MRLSVHGGGDSARPTVVSLLSTRAERQPEAIAYSFLSAEGMPRITYGELDRRARAVGRVLAGRQLAGAPVLLLYSPGIDYLAALFGCLYAGAIAIPACSPAQARLENTNCWLAAVARDAMPAAALMPAPPGSSMTDLSRAIPHVSDLRIVVTGDLPPERRWRPVPAEPESVALLQYTSGATAVPKGVALTHRNLMDNARIGSGSFGYSPRTQGVMWLPPNHAMGLLAGIIQPLHDGFPMALMAQRDFLRRPLSWLEAISRTNATMSGGPDSAYDLCVRATTEQERSRLDLSRWQVALNCAEPVSAETMEKFTRAFRVSGFRGEAFYPCYGLAEGTFLVAGGVPWAPDRTRSFDALALRRGRAVPDPAIAGSRRVVSCGPVAGDQRVLIVDPVTGADQAAGAIGEIWVAGQSVSRSYWHKPRETQTALLARLARTGAGPFARTGDLGFMLDGELHVVGRIKDLIVADGEQHHPQDIERTVERTSPVLCLGRGAAFLAAVGGEERLVVAYEVDHNAGAVNVADVAESIRTAVAAEHGLRVHTVVLVAPGGIARTSSGKVKRRLCAALFEQNKLAELGRSSAGQVADGGRLPLDRPGLLAVPAQIRRDLLRDYLCRLVAAACEIGEAEVADVPLHALGVDSRAVIRIQQSIEADLGVHVTAADFAHAAGIGDLAVKLDERLAVITVPPQSRACVPAGQRSLWFVREIRPGSAEHASAIALRLRGLPDLRALDHAVGALLARLAPASPAHAHDGLPPAQWIAGTAERAWLRHGDAGDADDAVLKARLEEAAREPFDLARGPLLRIHVYGRAARAETVLLVVTHRIIADSWSLTTFVRELELLHAGSAGGVDAPLPDLADFVRRYSWISGSRVSGQEQAETSNVLER